MARQEDLGKAIVEKRGKKKKSGDSWYSKFSDYQSLLTVDAKQMHDVCPLDLARFVDHPFDGFHAGFEPADGLRCGWRIATACDIVERHPARPAHFADSCNHRSAPQQRTNKVL